jgi:hypothetical protein
MIAVTSGKWAASGAWPAALVKRAREEQTGSTHKLEEHGPGEHAQDQQGDERELGACSEVEAAVVYRLLPAYPALDIPM